MFFAALLHEYCVPTVESHLQAQRDFQDNRERLVVTPTCSYAIFRSQNVKPASVRVPHRSTTHVARDEATHSRWFCLLPAPQIDRTYHTRSPKSPKKCIWPTEKGSTTRCRTRQ